jgi:hypothetical protein
VLEVQKDRVKIADGKHRKILRPKLKNTLHLAPTNTHVELDSATDKKLRTILAEFRNQPKGGS